MKYMTFIRHSESYRESGPPKALMEAMDAFVQQLVREGAFVDGGGLRASAEGARMRLAQGKLTTLDGPFTETKEIVGGYAILEAPTRARALEIATQFMELHRRHWPEFEGECEVRPMFSPGEGPKCHDP